MPRGRKPKVDLLLAPKEETKKVKSPWDKTKESTEEKTEVEFSQAVIDKNRQEREKSIAVVNKDGYDGREPMTCASLRGSLSILEGVIYWRESNNGYIYLYTTCNETDDEVISRLRQKKLELEKLKEELSDENT